VADAPLVVLNRGDYLPLGIAAAIGVQTQGLPLPAVEGIELVAQPGPEVIAQVQADHPLAVEAGDLAEGVIDPQDLEVGVRDDDAFMSLERHSRQPHQGIALQPLQLRHHAHREDGQHGTQIGGPGLARKQQGKVPQDLAAAIQQRLGVIVLAGRQAIAVAHGLAKGGSTGGPLTIELLAGHVGQGVLLDVHAVARQHPQPVKADPLRQPDRIGPQDMSEFIDQGLAEVEPGLGGKRLRQLGQQGGLQLGHRRGHPGGRLGTVHLAMKHLERGQPATAEPLGRHILAIPEHMVHIAGVVTEVADKLAGLTGVVESGEKIGKTRVIFPQQLPGPGMRPLTSPGLTREMIRQAPLLMLPIIKPHHLGGLLLH